MSLSKQTRTPTHCIILCPQRVNQNRKVKGTVAESTPRYFWCVLAELRPRVHLDFPSLHCDRQTSGTLLPPCMSYWTCLAWFPMKRPSKPFAGWNLSMNYIRCSFTKFSSCISEFFNKVFPAHKNMACSFPDSNVLDFFFGDICNLLFMLQKLVTFSASSNEYRIDLWWFVRNLEFSTQSGSHCSEVQWSPKCTFWAFFNDQVVVTRKSLSKRHMFIQYYFLLRLVLALRHSWVPDKMGVNRKIMNQKWYSHK